MSPHADEALFKDLEGEDDSPRITRLRADKRSPQWTWLHVPGRRAIRVPLSAVSKHDLRLGTAWSDELEQLLRLDSDVARAKSRAVSLLKTRSRSRAELLERLQAAGFLPAVAVAAVASLESAGLVDDAALARVQAETLLEQRMMAPTAVRDSLRRRGIADEATDRVIAAMTGGESEHDRAVAVAKKVASRLSGTLSRETRYRRVVSALARRGFCQETAMDAAAEVAGQPD